MQPAPRLSPERERGLRLRVEAALRRAGIGVLSEHEAREIVHRRVPASDGASAAADGSRAEHAFASAVERASERHDA